MRQSLGSSQPPGLEVNASTHLAPRLWRIRPFGSARPLTLCFVLDWAGARCQWLISCPIPLVSVVEAFFVSTLVVTLGEIGDKTQLLALLLAARFRRPLPIVAGIFAATLFNHALAGVL